MPCEDLKNTNISAYSGLTVLSTTLYLFNLLHLTRPVEMRRSFKFVKQHVKTKTAEGAIKEPIKEQNFSKWVLKEVLLSPNFPRAILLIFGVGSAISFYATNGGNSKKKSSKMNEPIGNIKVERYSDRLSRYATSIELSTNYAGALFSDRDNIAAVNAGFLLQDQLGMNFNDLTREQLLSIQAAQTKRNLSMKLHAYEKEQLNRASRMKLSRSLLKKESAADTETG